MSLKEAMRGGRGGVAIDTQTRKDVGCSFERTKLQPGGWETHGPRAGTGWVGCKMGEGIKWSAGEPCTS